MKNEARFEHITARSGETVTMLSKLKDAKHRRETGLYLAEGIKLAEEALGKRQVAYALLSEGAYAAGGEPLALAEAAGDRGARLVVLSSGAFEKVSTEMAPQGLVFVLRTDDPANETVPEGTEAVAAARYRGERLLMLSDVRDPGNFGTVLRSASAFGVDRVILSGCADLFSPKAVRASMGALFRLRTATVDDPTAFIRALQSTGRRVLATALGEHSLTLGSCDLNGSDVPVIGNEGHGLAPDVIDAADATLLIPMAPGTESLNAGVAASVVLWEYFRTLAN